MQPQTKTIVIIENIVSSTNLEHKLGLEELAIKFSDAEYSPGRFQGLIFRLKFPKATVMVFGSGNVISTGTKSKSQAIEAIQTIIDRFVKHRIIKPISPKVWIQNIVASVNFNGKIDLEMAASSLSKSMYEPEQFPGLIFRMNSPVATVLIFDSGRIVCTGTKREQDMLEAVNKTKSILEEKKLLVYS